jgi:hypothetical protein
VSKRAVAVLLALHAGVTWLAFALRIDEFPLTWAPMYAAQPARDGVRWEVILTDRARPVQIGWSALRADGGEERVRRDDLNVSTPAAGRLYFQRTWLEAPPRHRHKNSGGATLDRWLLGIPPGGPIYTANWEQRLIASVNETLGRAPGDPGFIVALRADRVRMVFDARSLAKLAETREVAVVRWRPEWDAGRE